KRRNRGDTSTKLADDRRNKHKEDQEGGGGVMGQLVSYRGSSVRGRKVHPALLAEIGSDARWPSARSAFSFS
ncbi:hypothetical protein X777_09561, partial [Ooceraea biroi]